MHVIFMCLHSQSLCKEQNKIGAEEEKATKCRILKILEFKWGPRSYTVVLLVYYVLQ